MINQTDASECVMEPPAARITRALAVACGIALAAAMPLAAHAQTLLPFYYIFNSSGTLYEAPSLSQSTSPYFWLKSGAALHIESGRGYTLQGDLSSPDSWYKTYAAKAAKTSDNGTHPQNLFELLSRDTFKDISVQTYFDRTANNLTNQSNRHPYSGESLFARYKDENNYYYAGIRADGYVVIKKKVNGTYTTLATKKVLEGSYNNTSNPDLIPLNTWIGLKFTVTDDSDGVPQLVLETDVNWTGAWTQVLKIADTKGTALSNAGSVGIESDYADVRFDNFKLTNNETTNIIDTLTDGVSPTDTSGQTQSTQANTYDKTVLADDPSLFLALNAHTALEEDLSGNGNKGTYKGGMPSTTALPNGDTAADFNGSSQYVTVQSDATLSVAHTGKLTWEAWVRPDTLNFVKNSEDGYVDFMGKCADYAPTCEWEARMYGASTAEGRPDRVSAYVFNPSAGLGSAADWQPSSGSIAAGEWMHVVAEYDTTSTPSGCSSSYPGTISIWVNGVKQSFADHAPTGCMSQYKITPQNGSSPLNIGTMALDTWFEGAIGKVAIYNHLLSQSQINTHFTAMTGAQPVGVCGNTCTIPLLSSILK